jgi:hypothetical protein
MKHREAQKVKDTPLDEELDNMEWFDTDETRDLLCNSSEVGPQNVVKTLLKLTKSVKEADLEKKLDI